MDNEQTHTASTPSADSTKASWMQKKISKRKEFFEVKATGWIFNNYWIMMNMIFNDRTE